MGTEEVAALARGFVVRRLMQLLLVTFVQLQILLDQVPLWIPALLAIVPIIFQPRRRDRLGSLFDQLYRVARRDAAADQLGRRQNRRGVLLDARLPIGRQLEPRQPDARRLRRRPLRLRPAEGVPREGGHAGARGVRGVGRRLTHCTLIP